MTRFWVSFSPLVARRGDAVSDATGFGKTRRTMRMRETRNAVVAEAVSGDSVETALRANPELEKIVEETPELRGRAG